CARDRGPSPARLVLSNREIHRHGQLDADHRVLVAEHAHSVALLEEGEHVRNLRTVECDLIVGPGVHEMVEVPFAIEVGGLRLLDPHGLELLAAAEAVFEDRAVANIAKFRLDDRAGPGEFYVLDADDAQQLALHLEHAAGSEVIRLDQPGTPSPSDSRVGRGPGSRPPRLVPSHHGYESSPLWSGGLRGALRRPGP